MHGEDKTLLQDEWGVPAKMCARKGRVFLLRRSENNPGVGEAEIMQKITDMERVGNITGIGTK